MELNHDWRGFRSVFQPRRKVGAKPVASDPANEDAVIHLVIEDQIILAVLGGEGEDLTSWVGRQVEALMVAFPNREKALIDRKEADVQLSASLGLSHFLDQALQVRENTNIDIVSTQSTKKLRVEPSHFLLAGIQSWWSKILPSAFGIFIRLEADDRTAVPSGTEVFLLIRRGRLERFHCPNLSFLGAERSRQTAAVVKYLSEKHNVPVQGLMVSSRDWAEWSDHLPAKEAWKKLALAVQSNEAQLVPFRWQMMTLVATRAFLGL